MGFALFHVVISVAGDAVTSMAGLESAASRAWAEPNQKVKPITKTLACPSYERQSKRERERGRFRASTACRSITGFALAPMPHNNSPLLQVFCDTSAAALCSTSGRFVCWTGPAWHDRCWAISRRQQIWPLLLGGHHGGAHAQPMNIIQDLGRIS